MAQTFRGRDARRALVDLLSAFGDGLHVVVIDARGLVLGDLGGGPGARRAGMDDDGADDLPQRRADDAEMAAVRARIEAERQALADLAAAGWREVGEDRPIEGGGVEHLVVFVGPGGDRLGWNGWRDLVEHRMAETATETSEKTQA